MRGADLLIRTLEVAGVSQLFSLSGNQIMPLYDACIDTDISIVHTRHEAAAVFMADAWAQLTGNVGVCLVTAAPGAANAVGALYSAQQSESPVLLLTGDSPRQQDGSGAFQELDQIAMTSVLTRRSFRASRAEDLGRDIARALRIAQSARPGPVHVALPFDVLEAPIAETALPPVSDTCRTAANATQAELELLTNATANAARPVVLCGPAMNATRHGPGNRKLADALDVPVIAMESPRGLNDPSLGALKQVLADADLIVCLGKSVNFTLGFGRISSQSNAGWIVVDADLVERDRAAANLGEALVYCIDANPLDVSQALVVHADSLQNTQQQRCSEWRRQVQTAITVRHTIDCKPVTDDALPATARITPAQLCAVLQARIDKLSSTVVVCDGGEFGQWAQACTAGTCRIINGPSGAIGGGLCYAVAACKARPDSTVFALMGDGTVGFHFAEFETALRENTPVIVVIGNDQCWNAEHQIQLRQYGKDRTIGCELSDARYDLAVEGLGGHGEFVTKLEALDGALQRSIESGKAACVNVMIEGLPAPVLQSK